MLIAPLDNRQAAIIDAFNPIDMSYGALTSQVGVQT
jgi:hypothetical protein